MTTFQSKLLGIVAVIASMAVMLLLANTAFAQSAGAIAGSTSGSTSGASAGAAGIIIGGSAPSNIGTPGTTGTTGTAGSISAFSPVGVGVGGSASSSSNASPTIVVGSGNTYEASDLSKRVPGVWAPALTNSNGTCMGSFSSGLGVSGFGGSFGKTYTSKECNARFNANQMNALKQPEVAYEIMCGLDSVYEADMRAANQLGKLAKCAKRPEPKQEEIVTLTMKGNKVVASVDDPEWVLEDDGMLHYVDTYEREAGMER